ncbi:hypothetical protein [Roseovarius sp. 2305UL8-3]|uniref:hypothetical protein n=1 Tax=Roseovarius conchicola TaxID=3121636 RepID=UPI003527095A
MSPLSETFLIVAGFSALFTGLALGLFVALRHSVLWAVVATLATGGLAIWMLLAMGGGPGYLGRAGWIALGVVLGAVAFALVWAAFVRFRISKHGLPVALIALAVPALVALAVTFERQMLPNAVCVSDAIPLKLGQFDFQISPDFNADLRLTGAARESVRYSYRARHKEDMRRLCDLTDGGDTPLAVDMVWMSPGAYALSLDQACTGDVRPFYCQGDLPDGFRHLESLQLMIRDETTLRYEMSHALKPASDTLYFDGNDLNGEMCLGDDESSGGFVCRVWRALDKDTIVLVTGRSGGLGSHEFYLSSLKGSMDFMLQVMAR